MWVYSRDQQGIHNDKPALISSWAVWSLGWVPFQSQMTSLFGGYHLIHRGGLGLTLSNFPPIAIKWGYPLIFTQDKTTPLVIQSKPLNHLDHLKPFRPPCLASLNHPSTIAMQLVSTAHSRLYEVPSLASEKWWCSHGKSRGISGHHHGIYQQQQKDAEKCVFQGSSMISSIYCIPWNLPGVQLFGIYSGIAMFWQTCENVLEGTHVVQVRCNFADVPRSSISDLYGRFLKWGIYPHSKLTFHYKPSSYWGTPMTMETISLVGCKNPI